MNIWIVYDSKFGSNIKIAGYMKQLLAEDHDVHMEHARNVSAKALVAEKPDVLLFGGPLRMGNLSLTIRRWASQVGKQAKKQGLVLERLASWETKSHVGDGEKKDAQGIEKKLLDKMEKTPDVLKGLMNGIPCKTEPVEPLSIFITMPPDDEMSMGVIEPGYQAKVESFLTRVFNSQRET